MRKQYVATRSMTSGPDPEVSITGDPIATVRELKREHGAAIWLAGGAKLAGTLLPEIDELIVKIYPVTVGSGVPLFDTDFHPDTPHPDRENIPGQRNNHHAVHQVIPRRNRSTCSATGAVTDTA